MRVPSKCPQARLLLEALLWLGHGATPLSWELETRPPAGATFAAAAGSVISERRKGYRWLAGTGLSGTRGQLPRPFGDDDAGSKRAKTQGHINLNAYTAPKHNPCQCDWAGSVQRRQPITDGWATSGWTEKDACARVTNTISLPCGTVSTKNDEQLHGGKPVTMSIEAVLHVVPGDTSGGAMGARRKHDCFMLFW